MRKGAIKRVSKETQIQASLTIEGRGRYDVSTGIRFFDHMLELFAHHGGFDLKLKATGGPRRRSAPHGRRCRHRVGAGLRQRRLAIKAWNSAGRIFFDANGRNHGHGRGRLLRPHRLPS